MLGDMAYWGKVAKRAGREAASLVGLGSAERVVVVLTLQAVVSLLIYIGLGETTLEETIGTRLAVALSPFAVWPVAFLYKLLSVPAAMHAEHRVEEDTERRANILYLTQIYLKEEKPDNAELIRLYLAYPPAEWLNPKLEELGFAWRVEVHPGARITTYDVE